MATIHRPFFMAGIGTVLTLGCVWGAINLFTIGMNESFSAVSYSWVLAHGHAMVFGFVGFFIMGFAYQAIPRFKQTTLRRPRLAFSSLPLMVAGLVLQTIAHLLSPPSLSLEVVASVVQLAAGMTSGNRWLLTLQWLTAVVLLLFLNMHPGWSKWTRSLQHTNDCQTITTPSVKCLSNF